MGISGDALSNLVISSLNRYVSNGLTAAESAAIQASATSGVLNNFIQTQINTLSAAAPQAGAQAIFSTGYAISDTSQPYAWMGI